VLYPDSVTLISYFSGNGSQTALVSWFPLPTVYESSNYVYWAELSEAQFTSILKDIAGGGQPKTQSQWRNFKGGSMFRKLKACTSAFSEEFLQSHEHGGL
jgi:hypothetical protein